MQNNLLPDPAHNRVVSNLKPPPHRPLPSNQLFKGPQEVDWTFLMDHLKRQGRVSQNDFVRLIDMVCQILRNEPNLVKLQDPVTVVGDIHGQYYDLLKLLEMGGSPMNTKYLFLGDYVDRGSFSIQCLILLFALKITFPTTVMMLRGNHECRQLTAFFNFRQQCLHKYNQEVYDRIMILFDLLPIAGVLNNKFFCTHGGLSPELMKLEDINKVERAREIPKSGLLCDLMWADPIESESGQLGAMVKNNDVRGCSYFFGYELTKNFLERNGLISVIRAHEAQIQGYKFYKWSGSGNFPTVITIFSAPNYCDVYNNKGAVIKFQNSTLNVQQYNYSQHPYLLPNFMDVFTWSLPFVAQKISQIFYYMLMPDKNSMLDSDINYKARLLQELYAIQHQQKKKNEQLVNLGGMCPDDKLIESGVSIAGVGVDPRIQTQVFTANRNVDMRNERRPDLK